MKNIFLIILSGLLVPEFSSAQNAIPGNKQTQDIYSLIDQYSQAREKKDTALLESILTTDMDQLVSNGVWRTGKDESMQGMLQSSASNPGTRTINIEKLRFLNSGCGIVDARYAIQNTEGPSRRMWSTFIVVFDENMWKIAAIRNMLPAE